MSTTASRGFQDTSRRAYVAAIPFNNDLYIYTAGPLPNGTMGALGPYPKATALNCPAGRILRETGNKIYPDANPGITTTMVAVYDEVTFFTGFIDRGFRLVKALDVYISSSIQEAFGRVLLEAMLAKVPIIATAVNGNA